MSHPPRRTAHSGPALIRLLSRLTDADVIAPSASLSTQLSEWLGWTDAIALSAALTGNPPAAAPLRASANPEARDCARMRTALTEAITGSGAAGARRRAPGRAVPKSEPGEAPADYAVHRHRYVTLQQTMATDISFMRGRLRKALSARKPEMAKLAMVDAVMERVLGAREQALLGNVPTLLEAHYERLRAAGDTVPGAWLRQFHKDMQSVLLAELDIRFEPVEGLLEALSAG